MSDDFSLSLSPSQQAEPLEEVQSSQESQSSDVSQSSQVVQIEDRFFWFRKAVFWAKTSATYQTSLELLEIDEKELLDYLRNRPNKALERDFATVKALQKRAKNNLKAANEFLEHAKSMYASSVSEFGH